MPFCRLFESNDLLPAAWQEEFGDGPVRVFNPGLLRADKGWIFAFRAVGPDLVRRIGICRLGPELQPIAGSSLPWSDQIRFPPGTGYPEQALGWFADPRLYRLNGRLFVYWNSGWHEPQNFQFLQEIDPLDFRPLGPPRELRLRGPRRPLEKNWTLFGADPIRVLYSLRPQRVLTLSLAGEGPIECVGTGPWEAAPSGGGVGELRGGAPPQLVGDHYFAIGHVIEVGPGGYRYAAAVHRFGRQSPFVPSAPARAFLPLPNPRAGRRLYERLNPAVSEAIYPCGADYLDGEWTLSYGLNDECCAVAVLPHAELLATLPPD